MLCHTYTLSAIPGSRTVGHIPGIPNRANSQNTRPNSRVQVTPLARPVTRGVFRIRPMPTSVPISMPASGAPDADRWAAESRRSSFHGGANENQTQILYTHARKSPSEPSEIYRGVNLFTPEYEIACPNRETDTEASIILHSRTK